MHLPDYIDNLNHDLASILTDLIQSHNEQNLDIATEYFRNEAWLKFEDIINQLTQCDRRSRSSIASPVG